MAESAIMPAKNKRLQAINVRLPKNVVFWLKGEKKRTGMPIERLVESALLSFYLIKTKGQP